MKKLIIAALLIIGFSSYAQGQNQPEKKSNNGQREKMTPEQRSQAQLDKLTTELKLDVKQQEQIKPIIAEQTAKREAMRAERMASNDNKPKELTKEEREALKVKRTEEKVVVDNKLKAILTPEQFKKMKEIEQANMEKMREAREARGNQPQE
ncbi:MAG: Spy/CpxP family protein refolding chaperone [Flavobacterium sp.]|nr:Spy/CpxP family protein refolding chaperone [Flavobacterium sp.]